MPTRCWSKDHITKQVGARVTIMMMQRVRPQVMHAGCTAQPVILLWRLQKEQ